MCRPVRIAAVLLASAGACWAQGGGQKPFGVPVAKGGGIEVYAKVDFDQADPFRASGSGKTALETDQALTVGSRSLHVSRSGPEGYFGASMPVQVAGSKGLKIAFCIRAKGMQTITLNFRDTVKDDNTTPRSPAILTDAQQRWVPVVLHVEDFRYNGGGPEAIDADTRFISLTFHGREMAAGQGEYWLDNLVIYRGDDTAAPGPPASLKATAGEGGRVVLSWKPAKDNAFPAVYSVHHRHTGRWQKVGETTRTRFAHTVHAPGLHSYRVTAADYEHNVSRPAVAMPVNVPKAAPPERPAPLDDRVKDRRLYAAAVRRLLAAGGRRNRRDAVVFFGDQHNRQHAYFRTLSSYLRWGIPIERSFAGKDTAAAKAEIAQVLREDKPLVAVVLFGTNDGKDAASVAKAMGNLSAVVDACVRNGTIPILSTIPPGQGPKDGQQGEQRFNQALVKLARQKRVPVSYCFEELMGGDFGKILNEWGTLTAEGGDLAGRALRKTFDQVLWALRDAGDTLR